MMDDDDDWEDGDDDRNGDDADTDDDCEMDEVLSLPLSEASTVESTRSSPESRGSRALAVQRKEAKRVRSVQRGVVLFLVLGLIVSLAMYGVTVHQETVVFETKFKDQADKVFDISSFRMEEFFSSLSNLGVSFSAQVESSSDVWPYVLISNYEAQASTFFQQRPPSLMNGSLLLSVLIPADTVEQWEQYAVAYSPLWIQEAYETLNLTDTAQGKLSTISPVIYSTNIKNGTNISDSGNSSLYSPFWMASLNEYNGSTDIVNYNSLNDDSYAEIERGFKEQFKAKGTKSTLLVVAPSISNSFHFSASSDTNDEPRGPQSVVATALFDSFYDSSRKRVATLSTRIAWYAFFEGILEDSELDGEAIILTFEDTCGLAFMYEIRGSNVKFTGTELEPVLPTSSFIPIEERKYDMVPMIGANCSLIVHMIPSDGLIRNSKSQRPIAIAASVAVVFVAIALIFWYYDRLAGQSYRGAVNLAQQLSFLPKPSPRPSLMGTRIDMSGRLSMVQNNRHSSLLGTSKTEESQLDNTLVRGRHRGEKAIADLHPSVTVMYADIANFTAWSSVREPAQVFELLETLYDAFDKLCVTYKIFKVETVGDSYVAVSGIPVAVDEHAVNMSRFACEMMNRMARIVQQLELSFGPETAELTLRIGMSSGPVTAGVLRGEKSRFQLFGETVNTASRMEGTGMGNRIQASATTANHLRRFGKDAWMTPRDELVQVKGRGEVQTYWINVPPGIIASEDSAITGYEEPGVASTATTGGSTIGELDRHLDASGSGSRKGNCDVSCGGSVGGSTAGDRTERLVDWCADLLLGLLKKIVAMRESEDSYKEYKEFEEIVRGLDESVRSTYDDGRSMKRASAPELDVSSRFAAKIFPISPVRSSFTTPARYRPPPVGRGEPFFVRDPNTTVLDEVAEIISLPRKTARYQQDPNKIELSSNVVRQLYRFVREVAKMYRTNPFHNFQHASHVTMSLTKLLSRVVAPDEVDYENMTYKKKAATSKLHKFTFGITSDPITQFACAFSSMIHDMDHPGVPNGVLVSEGTAIAKRYGNKSVAEQNSVDLAWNLLMEPRYKDLRHCIYRTQSELERFRQLVVNSVMATDIVDKELGQLRKNRWERAFSRNSDCEMDEKATDEVNRKATIVIEHLIQAADVAHTMQHWHVYLKWNERFFQECYVVYLSGRSATDPSEGWYKGEIGFFDYYIIPLAKKLESCGVFGVSSDECLSYAQANRDEWERKGEGIVRGYIEKYRQ